MNIDAISSEKITEKNQQNVSTQKDNEDKQSFSEEYKLLLAQNGINVGALDGTNSINLLATNSANKLKQHSSILSSIHSSFNYDTLTISKDDALFFNSLVEKTDYILNSGEGSNSFQSTLLKITNDAEAQTTKTTEISKSLMNLIEEAYKTQKPMRIDFDNNVSVILRIGKDGKISAEFLPGDKAVEQYLRNNIGYLKERLDEQNLDYGDIMYKPYKDNSKKERNNRKGEHQ